MDVQIDSGLIEDLVRVLPVGEIVRVRSGEYRVSKWNGDGETPSDLVFRFLLTPEADGICLEAYRANWVLTSDVNYLLEWCNAHNAESRSGENVYFDRGKCRLVWRTLINVHANGDVGIDTVVDKYVKPAVEDTVIFFEMAKMHFTHKEHKDEDDNEHYTFRQQGGKAQEVKYAIRR